MGTDVTLSTQPPENFRGCLPADHYDDVGQLADHGPDPDTGFDPLRFYAALARGLDD